MKHNISKLTIVLILACIFNNFIASHDFEQEGHTEHQKINRKLDLVIRRLQEIKQELNAHAFESTLALEELEHPKKERYGKHASQQKHKKSGYKSRKSGAHKRKKTEAESEKLLEESLKELSKE